MKYIELAKHIYDYQNMAERLAPMYIVFGDDEYLIGEALKQFEGMIDKEFASFNITKFSKDDSILDVVDALNTFPMFDKNKLVILEGKALKEDEKKILNEYFSDPNKEAIFVVYFIAEPPKKDGTPAKRNAQGETFSKLDVKGIQFVDCGMLEFNALSNEVIRLCLQEPKVEIDSDAIKELATRTQNKMARVVGEVAKLKSYVDKKITVADVKELVQEDLDFKGYEFASAVSEKNSDKAISILDVFLKAGYSAPTIFAILYDKYRKMFHAELNKDMSNDDLGKVLGMSGSAVYYLRKVSSTYTQVRLKRCVDYLHLVQYELREGKLAEDAALHNAIISMLNM